MSKHKEIIQQIQNRDRFTRQTELFREVNVVREQRVLRALF